MQELVSQYKRYKEKLHLLGDYLDIPKLEGKIRDLEADIAQDSFWDNNAQAQSIFETLNRYKSKVSDYKELQTYVDDMSVYHEMLSDDENDNVALDEFNLLLTKLVERVDQIELQSLYRVSMMHHRVILV